MVLFDLSDGYVWTYRAASVQSVRLTSPSSDGYSLYDVYSQYIWIKNNDDLMSPVQYSTDLSVIIACLKKIREQGGVCSSLWNKEGGHSETGETFFAWIIN